MFKLHKGEVTIWATVNTKTGEESHRLQAEYPPEEALESLASRVRPLILSSEPTTTRRPLTRWSSWSGPTR